ncbi:MAG: DUF1003 domain-containing protein [Acidothermus cellulolyticus]|nr:DUF1003 domain-containing protein [Acidothermus cellulolyticus]MCL6549742.1 DUF1003 domain-containing protein [Acidothermus cellulolyticus]
MARTRFRLDQPAAPRRVTLRPGYDPEAFGRFAERFARFMGTAKFIVYMTAIVILWVAYNLFVGIRYYHTHHDCTITRVTADNEIVTTTRNIPRCQQGLKPFDPYPFILLNLFFSTQASYAAPLILLAQNRQADRDRVQMEEDRARAERNIADTEYLTREVAAIRIALGNVATRDFVRDELRRLLEEFEERREPATREGEPQR